MAYEDRPWVKSYDEWIEPDAPLPDVSYVELLETGLRDYQTRAAFHFLGASRTFGDLDRYSRQFAGFLAEIGCEPGDVVAICLPNTPQFMIALAGALRAGCIVTGASLLLAPRELVYQLEDSGAKVLVTLDAAFEQKFLRIRDQVPRLSHVVVTNVADFLSRSKRLLGKALKKIPTGRVVPVPGKTIVRFMDILRRKPGTELQPRTDRQETCLIMYTGGTTGTPKGAEITGRNIVAIVHQSVQWMKAKPGAEVYCSAFPFFHIAGLAVCLWSMATGSTQILVPNPRDTRRIARDIARYRPTILLNVPSLYQLLLDDPAFRSLGASSFERLRGCLSGAAPFSPESIAPLEDVVGQGKVTEVFGMTETTALVTLNPTDRTKKLGSVGLPLPNTLVKIVDLETGTQEMPLGQEGELIVQAPQVMKGYWNKPEETAHALREFHGSRWLYTGDVARLDEDGYLYIVDRAKDMINVGGFKVFSREFEETLCEHPAVEYCAMVGMADPNRPGSERVKAVIQLAPAYKGRDEHALREDLVRYCRENMAPYKVPRCIEFVEQMPLTPIGKVDKKALREAK